MLGAACRQSVVLEYKVAAVALVASFTSTVDVAAGTYWFLPVRLLLKDRFDSISKIGRVRAPFFMVHGERDRIVPTRLGRRLFAAANDPKEAVYLPQAGHNDLPAHGGTQAVIDFLMRQFPTKG